MNARQPVSWWMTSTLPSPCTAFSQSLSVNLFRWRIRGERAGNALTFSNGPRGPQRFGREEKRGLGTRQTSSKVSNSPASSPPPMWLPIWLLWRRGYEWFSLGKNFFPKPLELEIFSRTYNSVRFFFSIVYVMREIFFSAGYYFFQVYPCKLFPLEISLQEIFDSEITHNLLESQIIGR